MDPSTANDAGIPFTRTEAEELNPEEGIDEQFRLLNRSLKEEILDEIAQMSPLFFEKLVLDLLYAMGYGSRTSSDPLSGRHMCKMMASMERSKKTNLD